jgi:hypothetical protein
MPWRNQQNLSHISSIARGDEWRIPVLSKSIHSSNFDSTLFNTPALLGGDTTPWDLVIYLKVCLKQKNPPGTAADFYLKDSSKIPRHCVRWADPDWRQFVNQYQRQVQDFWDENFLLTPPASYRKLDWPEKGPKARPRQVKAGFRLQLLEHPAGAHATISCVRLDSTTAFFRSNSLLYDSNDLDPLTFSTATHRVDLQFLTSRHEVGHLLGLGHSNENSAACRAHPNSEICYGASLSQRMNIMGEGSMLDLEDAEPWLKRAARHTSTNSKDWKASWASTEAAFRGAELVELR